MLNIIYILHGDWEVDHRRPQMTAMALLCNLICIDSSVTIHTVLVKPKTFFKLNG